MGRINPLVNDFLQKHPADCARILEQLPLNTACSLILSIQPGLAAGIVECMVTSCGSACVHALDTHTAVRIIREMKIHQAARLLRAMTFNDAHIILDMLPMHVRNNIHAAFRYPDQTVGRVMDANPFSMPESVSINDAVKRVKNLNTRTLQEIFVVDDDHKLRGVIHIASLLSAPRSSSLQTILSRDVPYLSTRTHLNAAAAHSGWQTYSTLPVVGSDHILSGILKSSTLMHVLSQTRSTGDSPDALNELFSMTKMYWIVMAELINALGADIKERKSQRD